MSHEEFFKRWGRAGLAEQFESRGGIVVIDIEALYQAFKARLMAELVVDVHGASNYGVLVNTEMPPKEEP